MVFPMQLLVIIQRGANGWTSVRIRVSVSRFIFDIIFFILIFYYWIRIIL